MLKGIDARLGWGVAAFGLLCMGLGAAVFSRTTGWLLVIIGLAACFLWYSKYGKKKAVIKPVNPVAPIAPSATSSSYRPSRSPQATVPPLSDKEAAQLMREEMQEEDEDAKLARMYREKHPNG